MLPSILRIVGGLAASIALLTFPAEGQAGTPRPWLGVALEQAELAGADAKAPPRRLPRIKRVMAGSAAERAGVEAGDLVLRLDGTEVATVSAMIAFVGRQQVGGKLTLDVLRGDAERRLVATLGERPDPMAQIRDRWLNKPLPDAFSFVDVRTGARLALGQLKGKPYILEYWATTCSPCKRAAPWLKALVARHQDAGLSVLSVSNEPRATVQAFLAKHPAWDHAVAVDPDDLLQRELRLYSMPTFFYVDAGGVVRAIGFGARTPQALADDLAKALPAKPAPTAPAKRSQP